MPDTPKYPKVVVSLDLNGPQGNAYVVMGSVQDGLKKIGVSDSEIAEYLSESMSDDYEHLLATAGKWVTFVRVFSPPTVRIET